MSLIKKCLRAITDNQYRFELLNEKGFYKGYSDEYVLKRKYYYIYGETPNFTNPHTLDEKLQWLKIHDHNPIYTTLVDKYESKLYLRELLGEDYSVPTLGVWEAFDDIDFEMLPDKFILKTTHDSGTHVICIDKATFNKKQARKILEKSLKRNYYTASREWPYKNVKPRIIAEILLENRDASPLVDYKFYCYGGRPVYFMYSIGEADHNVRNHKFDMEGNSIDSFFKKVPKIDRSEISLPKNLDEMIRIVESLSNIAQHVRVDLYNIDGKIYLGEITFFTNSGFISIDNAEYKQHLADLIDIEEVRKHRKNYCE